MVVLICPKCASRTVVAPFEGAEPCSSCGHLLSDSDTVAEAEGHREDEVLVAELRDAFENGACEIAGDSASRRGASGRYPKAGSVFKDIPALAVGSRLGDFEIIGELGRGGMGIVYRARQWSLDREVALKVLPGAHRCSQQAIRRFRTEAQAAARLHHENVVPVYAQGEHEGHLYYSMKLIEGISLGTAIRSRPELLSSTFGPASPSTGTEDVAPPDGEVKEANIPGPETADGDDSVTSIRRSREDYRHIARLVAGAADGLAHAHANGVVHRDVKPHNLLLGWDRRLHITDFGLAYLRDAPHLTVTGEIMGTPVYLSPEQVRGDTKAIDHRTDVYSLGVTMYEMITGHRPFEGETRDQILHDICTTRPRAPRRLSPSIPVDLETICLRAMHEDPARRHPSAQALAEDLRRFADGRPILSRRTSLAEKTVKWVRRHKAVTTALAATSCAVILTAGLTASVAASRRDKGAQLLERAYSRLAHLDYRSPYLVAADIERAERLGVDAIKLLLTKALANMGGSTRELAEDQLADLLEQDPANDQAVYLLAWAQWANQRQQESRETLERADQAGGPISAEAWFFRGMAIHSDRPSAAIKSYRRAIKLRARQNEFYPQAVLHSARGYNQRFYAHRAIDDFSEVEARLIRLVEQGHYGSYPHYLLSIAHRLAGEIYDGSAGAQAAMQARRHFDEALAWAREGQAVDPPDDRSVVAEAECLEAMGRLEEALEARTRALELADSDPKKWEAYHYRWRLHYWLNDPEAALADLEAIPQLMPAGASDGFYTHVYPALIRAEQGHMDEALAHARALANAAPDDAQAVLWSATCLRLLGRPGEARALLAEHAAEVQYDSALFPPQTEAWVEMLYRFCNNQESLGALLEAASASELSWKLLAEAHFHAAAMALATGRRHRALEHFGEAYRSFDSQMRYTFHSKLIFERMRMEPEWPPWISATSGTIPGKIGNVDERG